MKERLKMDRRAESRFVNVGACELPRISCCTSKGRIVLFNDILVEMVALFYLKYKRTTNDKIGRFQAPPANCQSRL